MAPPTRSWSASSPSSSACRAPRSRSRAVPPRAARHSPCAGSAPLRSRGRCWTPLEDPKEIGEGRQQDGRAERQCAQCESQRHGGGGGGRAGQVGRGGGGGLTPAPTPPKRGGPGRRGG